MYDPRAVANTVLESAWRRGKRPTNLDLQKVMYFLHGHSLRERGSPLLNEEFEAWPYGPVSKTAYQAFRDSGEREINQLADGFNPIKRSKYAIPAIADRDVVALIEKYIGFYVSIPTFLLVQITHEAGTPWSVTIENARERVNVGMRISDQLIVELFESPVGIVDVTEDGVA